MYTMSFQIFHGPCWQSFFFLRAIHFKRNTPLCYFIVDIGTRRHLYVALRFRNAFKNIPWGISTFSTATTATAAKLLLPLVKALLASVASLSIKRTIFSISTNNFEVNSERTNKHKSIQKKVIFLLKRTLFQFPTSSGGGGTAQWSLQHLNRSPPHSPIKKNIRKNKKKASRFFPAEI